jgi:hypothetical protein
MWLVMWCESGNEGLGMLICGLRLDGPEEVLGNVGSGGCEGCSCNHAKNFFFSSFFFFYLLYKIL